MRLDKWFLSLPYDWDHQFYSASEPTLGRTIRNLVFETEATEPSIRKVDLDLLEPKNLYKYVRWELELALELGLPIIVANLNKKNGHDQDRCLAILRNECLITIPHTLEALKHAMANWPASYRGLNATGRANGGRYYPQFDKKLVKGHAVFRNGVSGLSVTSRSATRNLTLII